MNSEWKEQLSGLGFATFLVAAAVFATRVLPVLVTTAQAAN